MLIYKGRQSDQLAIILILMLHSMSLKDELFVNWIVLWRHLFYAKIPRGCFFVHCQRGEVFGFSSMSRSNSKSLKNRQSGFAR